MLIFTVKRGVSLRLTVMPYEWYPLPDEIARRIYRRDVHGFFRKMIVINGLQQVLIVQDSTIIEVLTQGKHNVRRSLTKNRSAIYLDLSNKELPYSFSGLKLIDGIVITCYGSIRIRINDPQLFYTNLFTSGDTLRIDSLWAKIKPQLQNTVAPIFYPYHAEDIYGNPQVKNVCNNALNQEVQNTLQKYGLTLTQITTNYIFPQEWIDHYRGGLPT